MDINQIIRRTGMHTIIRNKTGEFLVLKRSADDDHDANFWDLPGGGIDPNEKLTEAIQREVREETNLSIDNINLIGAYSCDEGRLQLCALSELVEGDVQLSHEHSEHKWVNGEELLELEPAGLHLRAAQFFLKTRNKTTTYESLVNKTF